MSQQRKLFKERDYRNVNTLSICRPVLLSGNVQSEHVEAVRMVQRTNLSLCMSVVLSGIFRYEHVAVGEIFQTTI